jgi:hypothetical protein
LTLESLLDKWSAEFDKSEVKSRIDGADQKVDYDEQITVLLQHNHNAKE